MTWQPRHCIECYGDMEHCATCGCHDDVPTTSIENEHGALALDTEAGSEKAPGANRGQPTTTEKESK